MRFGYLFITAAMLAGCASDYETARTEAPMANQQEVAGQARSYRDQARQFREMAERRLAEAELLARDVGTNHELVQQKRTLATELMAKADEADLKARDLRGQVPHNMVQ